MSGAKNMDRWLGNGGMAIIAAIGGSFESYGVDGEDLGWVSGTFTPLELACNPHGSVQAGVHSVLLDAAMNFAINAALSGRDRTQATIEMTTELLRPARLAHNYRLRGDVVRLTRQVAYAEATVTSDEGKLVSRATGTFLVHRDEATAVD
ncbi:MAG: PaaI family thioesterase [Acidimicrobiales bacterium]